MAASTASSATPSLYRDLRAWVAPAAVGALAIAAGLLGLMALEGRIGTCFVAQCEGAHVPGLGLLAVVVLGGAGGLLAPAALAIAVFELGAFTAARRPFERSTLVAIAGGPVAMASAWVSAAAMGNAEPPWQWVIPYITGLAYVVVLMPAATFAWLAGAIYAVVLWCRAGADRRIAAALFLASIAMGIFGIATLFRDGGFD